MKLDKVIESLPTISAVDALAQVGEGVMPVDWDTLFEMLHEKVYGGGGRSTWCRRFGVKLGAEAWEQLQRVIVETPLPVTLCNTSFGFTVGIAVWTVAEEHYPGARVESECLFSLDPHFLLECPDGSSFDWAWELFEPMVSRPENLELLEQCRLELPKPKVHYAY